MRMDRLSVGDEVADLSGPRDLWRPGPPRWHALVVAPQREAVASAFLAARGAQAFYPVEQRTARRHGKRVVYERRMLPGYVFARIPGELRPWVLCSHSFFADVVRVRGGWFDGRPAVLRSEDLAALYDLRSRQVAIDTEAERQAAQRRAMMRVKAGGRGRILRGAYAGKVVDVLEVEGSRARIALPLFGAAVPADIDAAAMIAIGG